MKLVKLFGFVMAAHAAVFMFVFAIPGCRSSGKKPAAPAATPVGAETSPVAASDTLSPVASSSSSSSPAEVSAIRFSPTRPGTPAAAEVTAAPAPSTYTVIKGDNLWSIAKKHGLTVKELTAVNNLRSDSTLKLGQVLTLPTKASSSAAPTASLAVPSVAAPAKVATVATTHVVKAGETLGVIAKKYQVKVGDIATANNIADPTKLRVGQTLKIPGAHAATTKAAAPAASAAKTPAAPAPAPAPEAPAAPVFTSPFESTTTTPASDSPFITPAPSTDAPLIRVEESGAPRIE
ncbi:MAG: LysM peptidoglycan-binding domain-containing protein [Opitutaceae bacterium]|nr:LysM peptidoglycan-binding domain-containing protein [Opitutaceae bacterium]